MATHFYYYPTNGVFYRFTISTEDGVHVMRHDILLHYDSQWRKFAVYRRAKFSEIMQLLNGKIKTLTRLGYLPVEAEDVPRATDPENEDYAEKEKK